MGERIVTKESGNGGRVKELGGDKKWKFSIPKFFIEVFTNFSKNREELYSPQLSQTGGGNNVS